MNPKSALPALIVLAALASGCTSTRNKALDEKLASEQTVTSRTELRSQADKMIESDPSLSYDQKKQLSILRSQISTQMDELSSQSLKLRGVLVEEILSPNYSLDEVNLIKKRLKNVENKRLSLMFDGIDKANSILGRQAPQHARIMHELLENRSSRE
jgi:hypothetical protein